MSRARRTCVISLCTCVALDSAARRRSTAALCDTNEPFHDSLWAPMDMALQVTVLLIVAVSLGLIVWLCYRLLRWARTGTGGAHMLGSVLTEVTQSSAVQEAKQGQKSREDGGGDPPNGE